MKLPTFSIILAVLYAIFGLGLLLAPAPSMTQYGVTLDDNGVLTARILGSALTAFALIFYLNRNVPLVEKAQNSILKSSFIYNVIDSPVVLMATLNRVMNSMGWFPVILHVV